MTARALAERAMQRYLTDPIGARALAERARDEAVSSRDWSAAAVADRALGRIAGHLSDSAAARTHLVAAVVEGRRSRDELVTAQARADLAYVLMRQGRSRAALRELE